MPLTLSGTNGVSGIDGTASTPSLRGSDLTGNGIVYGTDTVQIATGGTTAVTVDSSQNLLVNTTAVPSGWTGMKAIVKQSTTNTYEGFVVQCSANSTGTYVGNTGSVGVIGTTYGSTGGYVPLVFETSSTERARIDSSGRLLVNTTSSPLSSAIVGVVGNSTYTNAVAIQANNTNTCIAMTNTSGTASYAAVQLCNGGTSFNSQGNITVNAATVGFNSTSDYRLKENVEPMQNALDKVNALNPVTFTWKVDNSHGQGFIAHELQAVVPDCVTGEKDAVDADGKPIYQSVDPRFLVATLAKSIQELSAKLDAAEARIAALEAK